MAGFVPGYSSSSRPYQAVLAERARGGKRTQLLNVGLWPLRVRASPGRFRIPAAQDARLSGVTSAWAASEAEGESAYEIPGSRARSVAAGRSRAAQREASSHEPAPGRVRQELRTGLWRGPGGRPAHHT